MSGKQERSAKKTKARETHGSRQARRTAGVVLQVLAGQLCPAEAAGVLEISTPGYYLLESRALDGLIDGCEPRLKRGRVRTPENELAALKNECARLKRDCVRYQALARAVQRSAGIAVPKKKAAGRAGESIQDGKKRRRKRKPTVRALSMSRRLGEQSKDEEKVKGENMTGNLLRFWGPILGGCGSRTFGSTGPRKKPKCFECVRSGKSLPMSNSANYIVVSAQREFVLIKDVGPWSEFLTVTNAAELVIQELWIDGYLHFLPRLFYVDTDEQIDELRYSIDGIQARFTGYGTILQEDTIGQMAVKVYEDLK